MSAVTLRTKRNPALTEDFPITPATYQTLKRAYQRSEGGFLLPDYGMSVKRFPFTSKRFEINGDLAKTNGDTSQQLLRYYLDQNEYSRRYVFRNFKATDAEMAENAQFCYDVFFPDSYREGSNTILLFHGLNERYWYKYLPWATLLASYTGSAVVLFPLAFHMGRAPADWSNPRIMQKVAEERRALWPDLKYASLANAAISQRLQFEPDRFLNSGIQSYRDARSIMKRITAGDSGFYPGGKIHFFGYSLGGLLAEVLLMSDPEGMTEDSRLFLLCGGSVVEHTKPISKTILDEEAYGTVSEYLKQLTMADLDMLPNDHVLAEGLKYFLSMLTVSGYREKRESRLLEISDRIIARTMRGDTVCPTEGVVQTLTGRSGKIPVDVQELDFPYRCRHEDPFPRREDPIAVNSAYNQVFKEAAAFYLK